MDPRHLSRLQEEQKKAISETNARIHQLENFKQDYTTLQERLKTLPDKVTHDVMVPFGKLAFMPGRLTHTNEILVLLGDNWFIERSAKQAVDIAGRRIQELDKKLKDLGVQQKLLEPRLGFTSDLVAEVQGRGDIQEIVEVYEESKEKLWDEQHRQNVKKYKEQLRRNAQSQNSQERIDNTKKTEDSLWSRLDELERQENERGEMNTVSDDENDNDDSGKSETEMGSNHFSQTERKVNWADEVKEDRQSQQKDEESNDDDGDSDDDVGGYEEDDDDEIKSTKNPVGKTIRFTHSQTPPSLISQVPEGSDGVIQSPADIYKLYCPKSILKKTASSDVCSRNQHNTKDSASHARTGNVQNRQVLHEGRNNDVTSRVEKTPHPDAPPSSKLHVSSVTGTNKAFTGFVIEKTSSDMSTIPAAAPPLASIEMTTSTSTAASITTDLLSSAAAFTATASGTSTGPSTKRVSKFRTSRQQFTAT